MRYMVSLFRIPIAAAATLVALAAAPAQEGLVGSVASIAERAVYGWLPDNSVIRLSPGRGLFVQAHVHPGGTSAVFWGGVAGRPQVWSYDFSARTVKPLTEATVGSVEPSYAWDGRRIAFASDSGTATHLDLRAIAESWKSRTYGYSSNLNLFVADINGSNIKRITHGEFKDTRPSFSPDGRLIAFLSNRGGDGDALYVIQSDGSGSPRRVLAKSEVGRPWFSVDGRSIYFFFSSVPDEHRRICRVPVAGGDWESVTPDGLPRSHGSFADLDGTHVWFHSTVGNVTTPYRFNLLTRELRSFMPPRFTTAGHITRARNNTFTFDSVEIDPWEKR